MTLIVGSCQMLQKCLIGLGKHSLRWKCNDTLHINKPLYLHDGQIDFQLVNSTFQWYIMHTTHHKKIHQVMLIENSIL